VRRREFIAALGGVAASALLSVLPARAQQAIPTIGFLHVAAASPMAHIVAGFRQGLKEQGIVEGQHATIEFRWADGRYDRLPALADDLARRRVAIIVTGGGEAPASAAKASAPAIPIVFNVGNDPVAAGLVASLGRPGGNATGVNILSNELGTKRLSLLHDLLPKSAIVANLVNPDFPQTKANSQDLDAAAQVMGRALVRVEARNAGEIEAAFATLEKQRVGGLVVGSDPFLYSQRDQIVLWATRLGIPAVYEQREFAAAGGLMSYGTSITDAYRQMGIYAGRILKGEKPADLPVVQSAKFELIVNLKAAKALGLTLPSGLLSIVDEVIE
jgi:putative ABC transport system substrate-binding protein